MKKIALALCASFLGMSLFAYDIASEVQVKGTAKSFTRTDFSIVSKFGEYFRTPSTKVTTVIDSTGKTLESTELTARDVLVNKITNKFDAAEKLVEQNCSDGEGSLLWKSVVSYKNEEKNDVSVYAKDGSLRGKTIYTYADKKLSEETAYNAEGALVEKTVYKYDERGRLASKNTYFEDGSLYEEIQYAYTDNGTKDSVTTFNAQGNITSKCIFRYGSNGALTEVTTYGPDNQTSSRQLVKYDSNGNISRITTYSVSRKFGTTVNEMTAMSEFSYVY